MKEPIHADQYVGDINTTACFTGHRPEGIPFSIEKGSDGYDFLSECIYQNILKCYSSGIRTFMTGMAEGIDLMAGQAVMRLKREHQDVRLVCAIPQLAAGTGKLPSKNPVYAQLVENADEIVYFFLSYVRYQFDVRNRFMVDNSRIVLAFLDESKKGGTLNTYKYAHKQNKQVKKIDLPRLAAALDLYFADIIQAEDLVNY